MSSNSPATATTSDATESNAALIAQRLLADTRQLPPVPANGLQIMSMAADDFIDLEDFAATVERDPAISARLIGLANSAFFAPKQPIERVEAAIVKVLGLDLARGVAVGMVCGAAFDASACPAFDFETFWQSSLQRSDYALQLAQRCTEPVHANACQLAALIDDLGLLAAAALEPATTNQVLGAGDADIGLRLQEVLGCSYHHLTAALAQQWQIPLSVRALLTGSPERVASYQTSVGVVQAADCLRSLDTEDESALQNLLQRLQHLGVDLSASDLYALTQRSAAQGMASYM